MPLLEDQDPSLSLYADMMQQVPRTAKELFIEVGKPYRKKFFLFFLLGGIGSFFWMTTPYVVAKIIDALTETPSITNIVVWLLVLFVFLRFAEETLWRAAEYVARSFVPELVEDVRMSLFRSTLAKSHYYFVNSSSGQLGHWINQASATTKNFISTVFWNMWGMAFKLVVAAGFLFTVHWALALLFIVWLILLFVFTVKRGRTFSELIADWGEEKSKGAGQVVDAMSNHLAVRSFTTKSYEEKLLAAQQRNIVRSRKISWRHNLITNAAKGQSANVAGLLGLVFAVWLYAEGQITIGELVLFIAYFDAASVGLWKLSWAINELYMDYGMLNNALEGLHGADERQASLQNASSQSEVASDRSVTVVLNNVGFAYPDQPESKILSSFDLKIEPKQKVGVVGGSGAGKSTLVALLLAFYDATEGEILVNGQTLQEQDPSFMRSLASYVPQETNLFNRTIKENVLYAKLDATNAQITRALELAEASDFVAALPKGIDTLIGERGVKLSGGQRQRIAIARAILRDAPLLILDEATSALDSVSEQAIQKALHTLMQDRTAVVVAHRLSTLKHLDKIIVMDQGRVVECGNHNELLVLDGNYADLWKRQKDGFLAA